MSKSPAPPAPQSVMDATLQAEAPLMMVAFGLVAVVGAAVTALTGAAGYLVYSVLFA